LGHVWFSKCVGLPEDWQTPRMGECDRGPCHTPAEGST
jgi:hypothetical protein